MSGVCVSDGFVVGRCLSLSFARDDGVLDCVEGMLEESVDATSAARLGVAVIEARFVVSG